MTYHFETEVTKALKQLLETETDYNIIIYAGKIHDSKEFHAHSNILRCRSKYFDNIISDKNIEKKDEKYVIYKPNISPQVSDVILKASRDGNTATEFHKKKCDNRGATIIVLKIKNSEGIIGGYNPLECDSTNGSFKRTKGSFLFSFTNKKNVQTAKVGYSNGNKYSIVCYPYFGPIFGYNIYYLELMDPLILLYSYIFYTLS
ncbi:unnamed protein product [Rhizophagus irregularis]|nr:unnamed protein product [Rhizophagus irregularis]